MKYYLVLFKDNKIVDICSYDDEIAKNRAHGHLLTAMKLGSYFDRIDSVDIVN